MISAAVFLTACTTACSARCCPRKTEKAFAYKKFTATVLIIGVFFSLTSVVIGIIGFSVLPSTVGSFNMQLIYALLLGDGLAGILWMGMGFGVRQFLSNPKC